MIYIGDIMSFNCWLYMPICHGVFKISSVSVWICLVLRYLDVRSVWLICDRDFQDFIMQWKLWICWTLHLIGLWQQLTTAPRFYLLYVVCRAFSVLTLSFTFKKYSFSTLTLLVGLQEWHPTCNKSSVDISVVTIWLELCNALAYHSLFLLLQYTGWFDVPVTGLPRSSWL